MSRLPLLACSVMLTCTAFAVQAQDTTPPQNAALQRQEIAQGEPARWQREDTTPAERARTLRKEIGAALAEARQACAKGAAAERPACLKQAQDTYRHDMAQVDPVASQPQR